MSIPWTEPTFVQDKGKRTPIPIESPCLRKLIQWVKIKNKTPTPHFFKSTKITTIFRLHHAEDGCDSTTTEQTPCQARGRAQSPLLSFYLYSRRLPLSQGAPFHSWQREEAVAFSTVRTWSIVTEAGVIFTEGSTIYTKEPVAEASMTTCIVSILEEIIISLGKNGTLWLPYHL